MVLMATIFYGGLFLLAAFLTGWKGRWDTWLPERTWEGSLFDLFGGVLLGLCVVFLSRLLSKLPAGRRMSDELAQPFRSLGGHEILLLAFLSGLAEEALFRCTLQPFLGLLLTSLLFGLLHFPSRSALLLWTAFATLFGLLIGAIVEVHPGLLLPAAAHITVNALNLRWLARSSSPPPLPREEPPSL